MSALYVGAAASVGCVSPAVTADWVYSPSPPAQARVVHLKSFNRLHDIIQVRIGFLDAIRGKAVNPRVITPAGVAYRDGRLYVCDTAAAAVHVWNLATGEAWRLGVSGDGALVKPVAVAVSGDNTVFVADTQRGEVVAFGPGRTVRRFRPAGRDEYRPTAVAVAEDRLYVADIAAHRIDVFSTTMPQGGSAAEESGDRLLTSFGEAGSELGRLYYPMGLAVGKDRRIYVSDMMNARVLVFDRRGRPITTIGRPGNRYGAMGKPRHLALAPDETLFIADAEFSHVHLFDDQGRLLMLLGGPQDQAGGTPMPVGVAAAAALPKPVASLLPPGFDAEYYLFVTNTIGSRRISLFAIR